MGIMEVREEDEKELKKLSKGRNRRDAKEKCELYVNE